MMPGTVQQVFFNFRGFLCRLSKKVKEKIVCLEIFMLYFLSGSGTSLTPFVQLCASECLQFPVSKFPSAVGQQIIVHHRGTPCCSLPPVCSCISFLSFSSCLPSHLLMWPIRVRRLQRQNCSQNYTAISSVIPGYWETTAPGFLPECSCSVCGDMVWGKACAVVEHCASSVWRRGLQAVWMSVWYILLSLHSFIHFLCCIVKHAAVVSVMQLLMAERTKYQLSHVYWNCAEVVK